MAVPANVPDGWNTTVLPTMATVPEPAGVTLLRGGTMVSVLPSGSVSLPSTAMVTGPVPFTATESSAATGGLFAGASAMRKVRGTGLAAVKFTLPPCDAVMVQEPGAVRWTVAPEIVQLPLAAKLTARPELAVALTVKGGLPNVLGLSGPKVIVWLALSITSNPVPGVAV